MFNKTKQYFEERAKWKQAGSPKRTNERIIELFQICSSNECEKYIKVDETSGKCGECGCNLSSNPHTHFNKLAWATTKCPLTEPKWLEESELEQFKEIIEDKIDEIPSPPSPPRRGGCGCGG